MHPRAIVLMTGSELTRGETHDANGPYLARQLTSIGVHVDEIQLVPDQPELLKRAIDGASQGADVVIVSGGLGPTADDHTVAIVSEVFGRTIYRHEEARRRMHEVARRRFASDDDIPANFFKQAEVVEGADVLLNPVGLAPGMALETTRALLFVLPGVPRELQALYEQEVRPRLEARFEIEPPRIWRAKIIGVPESVAEARIQQLAIEFNHVEYGIAARPGELLVKVVAYQGDRFRFVESAKRLIENEFAREIVPLPEGILDASGAVQQTAHAQVVHANLAPLGLTVATAESCTGGGIAAALTENPGSSEYFLGGVVAYANSAKEKLLGVPRALLDAHGAVSKPVCEAMARGACARYQANLAISTTGIAGPGGGSDAKPVGLVYIGLSRDRDGVIQTATHERRFLGNRAAVREQSVIFALELLRRAAADEAEARRRR